LRKKIVR